MFISHSVVKKQKNKQGKSEGFDSCDRTSNLTQTGFKSSIFQPMWPWNLTDDLKQGKSEGFDSCDQPSDLVWPMWPWNWTNGLEKHAPFSFVCHFIAISAFILDFQSGNAQIGLKLAFFVSHGHKIGQMTLKNNRAPLLCLSYFHASFRSHQWIQLRVTVRKRSNWVNIGNFLPPVTLKFHRWPLITIGPHFYVLSNFMHHFTDISEFKKKKILIP